MLLSWSLSAFGVARYQGKLHEIKKRFQKYDVYIINRDLQVIRTTLAADKGLDFKQFPNFAELLRKRMAGNTFVADRMDISTSTQKFKKYSYMPTPDHKYIIELSINIHEANPTIENLNIFTHADILAAQYDVIDEILFYKANKDGSDVGVVTVGEGPYLNTDITNAERKRVQEVIVNNITKSFKLTESRHKRSCKYIPCLSFTEEGELDWWNSYVIKVIYNDSILNSSLLHERNLFLFSFVLLLIAFALFYYTVNYMLRKTREMASIDSLTGLPNRIIFQDYFNNMVLKLRGKENNALKLALLYIDLNDFKSINDKYGHIVGDVVLQEVAVILGKNLRKNDMVIRSGGDEFLVLLAHIRSIEDVSSVISKLRDAFQAPLVIENKLIKVDMSIGMSMYPDHGQNFEDMIQKADKAMYREKHTKMSSTQFASQNKVAAKGKIFS